MGWEDFLKTFLDNAGIVMKETLSGIYMIFFTVLYMVEKKEHKRTIEKNHQREIDLLQKQMLIQQEMNQVLDKTVDALKGKNGNG
jgi:hypothetical protein